MAYTGFFTLNTEGLTTLYALPENQVAYDEAGAIAGSDSAVPRRYAFTLEDATNYIIRKQLGGSKSASDTVMGVIYASENPTVLTAIDDILAHGDVNWASVPASTESHTVVRRGSEEYTRIYFDFPVADLVDGDWVKTKWIEDGSSSAVVGEINYVRSIGANHRYVLDYEAADRPAANATGVVHYLFEAGDDSISVDLLVSDTNTITETIPSSPTMPKVNVPGPIVIGDDYLQVNNRAFIFTVPKPPGFVPTGAKCFFGGKLDTNNRWKVEGVIVDNGDTLSMVHELLKSNTQDLKCGSYKYSAEIVDINGIEITKIHSLDKFVPVVEKYT